MAAIEDSENISIDPDFTNEVIDIASLPQFENVALTGLESKYWIIKVLQNSALAIFILVGWFVIYFLNVWEQLYLIWSGVIALVLIIFRFIYARLAFNKMGYAFREHDVIYRFGVIAVTTVIIPFNRVQHVALHEGLLSRYFGLSTVMIFTAGGSSSDIAIPGIVQNDAQQIKQLLMEKIRKPL